MTKGRAGSRRRAREYALLALYRSDLAGEQGQPSLNALWEALMDGEGLPDLRAPESDDVEFAQRVVRGVEANRDEIDGVIEQCSTNWRLRRMPVVDRNILRIAAYELLHCNDIPGTVSCNEAVELAKRFGTAESRAFVNGIVDKIGRQLDKLPDRGDGRRA
jgi:N utilization substance protein B